MQLRVTSGHLKSNILLRHFFKQLNAGTVNKMPRMQKSRLAMAAVRNAFSTVPQPGLCPICRRRSLFVALGPWLREDLKCTRCKSSSRQRALIDYIDRAFPGLGEMHVYEPSPTAPTDAYLARHAGRFTWSQYSAEANGDQCEDPLNQDLQSLRFADRLFDLVVSQDVFEHIAEPRSAFSEVARVLKPGGSHVFTIPWYHGQSTETRARIVDGEVIDLHPPEYHSDPNTRDRSLVFTRFGSDIRKIISESSEMTTSVIEANDSKKGIRGESLCIFHSRKQTKN